MDDCADDNDDVEKDELNWMEEGKALFGEFTLRPRLYLFSASYDRKNYTIKICEPLFVPLYLAIVELKYISVKYVSLMLNATSMTHDESNE